MDYKILIYLRLSSIFLLIFSVFGFLAIVISGELWIVENVFSPTYWIAIFFGLSFIASLIALARFNNLVKEYLGDF